MIRVSKVDGGLQLNFSYDLDIVYKVKTIEGRKYNPENKTWIVPMGSIKELKDLFGESLNMEEGLEEKIEELSKEDKDFTYEISTIEDNLLRVFAKWALDKLPEYFFKVAASSTGKYHPSYALGHGGLVRHTKACIRIANELFRCETIHSFNSLTRDIIRTALFLHDGVKQGLNGSNYTVATHPLEVVKYIEDIYKKEDKDELPVEVTQVMEGDIWTEIKSCIESHMGQWNTDYRTKEEILPKPKTEIQKFVHLCDYLASRKILEVNFNIED